MNDIRYVCLSDMHLGEEDSLLTEMDGHNVNPLWANDVMELLAKCLRELISKNDGPDKPILILNGDILELALSEYNTSAMIFERFLELVMAKDRELFDKIVYIPGNHDHHLWELARETQYVDHVIKDPDIRLDQPWHKTEMFLLERKEDNSEKYQVISYFLDNIIKRRANLDLGERPVLRDNIHINIAYPNFGILSPDKDKCVVIHHGHFIEANYCLMSKLKSNLLNTSSEVPSDVQLFEAENFAWIDFLWSALGRSGDVGAITETLYEHMLDRDQMKKFISRVAKNLAKKYRGAGPSDFAEEKAFKWILERALNKISEGERNLKDIPLGEKAVNGMTQFLTAVRNQIIDERRGVIPSQLAFVFGHTHKPFLHEFNLEGFGKPVAVYNTGGWVVDKVNPDELFGGAVLLMNENLDACLLEMYREYEGAHSRPVLVRQLDGSGEPSPFCKRVESLVQSEQKPWLDFSNVAHRDVKSRARRLEIRIKSL